MGEKLSRRIGKNPELEIPELIQTFTSSTLSVICYRRVSERSCDVNREINSSIVSA